MLFRVWIHTANGAASQAIVSATDSKEAQEIALSSFKAEDDQPISVTYVTVAGYNVAWISE